jgi:aryl-alcohol dehydrogenase-like predicted oxidoreductase
MKYNKIGNTEYEVSAIGFGGEWMAEKTPEEVKKLTKYQEYLL